MALDTVTDRATSVSSADPTELAVQVVDSDVHPLVLSDELAEYMAEPFRSRYFGRLRHEVDVNASLYTPPGRTVRGDSIPPGGGIPGHDLAFLEQQLLVEAGVDIANLIVLQPKTKYYDPAFDSAMFAAHNAWLAGTLLSRHNRHGRFRGSIRVSCHDPAAAVREIEKWAGHPYVSQVYVVPEDTVPLGNPQFHPVWEAAARNGLPIGMHVTGRPGMYNVTPAGFPSYHMETMTEWPLYFMTNLASLVFEGVFELFPDLRITFVEGGFTWAAPFIWRLDHYWKELGAEVPLCRRAPSEYVRDHLRFTTQPIEEPEPQSSLVAMLEWLGADQLLLFSSDYPHYDFDNPKWVMPRLPRANRDRILFHNAIDWYGLPTTLPRDEINDRRDRLADGTARPTMVATRPQHSGYFAEHAE